MLYSLSKGCDQEFADVPAPPPFIQRASLRFQAKTKGGQLHAAPRFDIYCSTDSVPSRSTAVPPCSRRKHLLFLFSSDYSQCSQTAKSNTENCANSASV